MERGMTRLILVLPILPGRTEAWRRFAQELMGSGRVGFERICRHYGIRRISTWIATIRPRNMVVAQLEVEDHFFEISPNAAELSDPFERWLFEQIRELHGVDLDVALLQMVAEPVFDWGARQDSA
jgi:hypothetical protein